jgi:kinetochore protein Spc7/SPC105
MQSPKKAARSRKSIAHTPFLGVNKEKENATVDLAVSSTSVAPGIVVAKRARSKSIGPGGLDALKEDAGNRRQVVQFSLRSCSVEANRMRNSVCRGTVCKIYLEAKCSNITNAEKFAS